MRVNADALDIRAFWLDEGLNKSTRAFRFRLATMFRTLAWTLLLPVAVAAISDPDWEAFKHKYKKTLGVCLLGPCFA